MKKTNVTLMLALSTAVTLLPHASAVAKEAPDPATTFSVSDPAGDDHGDGMMTYPLNGDFEPGSLDMVAFAAKPKGNGTLFEVTFARPIKRPPARTIDAGGTQINQIAKLGFYEFNIDVYIDTDRKPGSGALNALPDRRAAIAPANAWERAVILTPRPSETQQALKAMMLRDLRRDKRAEGTRLAQDQIDALRRDISTDVETRVFFPTRVYVAGRKISFFVPDEFLGGPARSDWAYVVGVSVATIDVSFDIQSKYFQGGGLAVPELTYSASEETMGGGREGELDLQPRFIDILVPEGRKQEEVLIDYDLKADTLVQLPGVVPMAPSAPRQ
jgi:hypothetical protein